MSSRFDFVVLGFALLLTAAVYASGLQGDFLFDDFPQIVLNKDLYPLETFSDLQRVWSTGNAGPAGRPIAVLSFALQVALTGINPFYFKLVNLAIHLGNGVLVYFLARYVVLALRDEVHGAQKYLHYFPVLLASWWMLSPMGLGAVLYVVQRMTSLSATFSLLGLLWYLRFRQWDNKKGLCFGIAGLMAFTVLSFLSKEIGVLTLIYAYLLEWVIYQWLSSCSVSGRVLAVIRYVPVVLLVAASFWLWRYYDFELAYGSRTFSLTERVLTEARVLWFYIFQLFIPNVSWLTFYHDDFVVSQGFLTPISTLFAVVGHIFLISFAALSFKSARLVSFGIFWFYGGHLLESTIFPLELVFEHRNYLPMLGIYAAVLSSPFYLQEVGKNTKFFFVLVMLFMGGAAFATATRATDWGSPFRVVIEAEHKPNSARANFDAGSMLMRSLRENPGDITLSTECRRYFERAIAADAGHLAAFPGLIELAMLTEKPLEELIVTEFETRLAGTRIHPAVAFTVAHLDRLAKSASPVFGEHSAERLYRALLSNSSLPRGSKGHVLVALALSMGRRGDFRQKQELMREAVIISPEMFEFHLLYIEALLETGDFQRAKEALARFESLDIYASYRIETKQFNEIIQKFDHK